MSNKRCDYLLPDLAKTLVMCFPHINNAIL